MDYNLASSGGFILSPPASSTTSTLTPTLPHPRSTPLRPGGSKESAFIRHVDTQILHIQRRYAKRTAPITNSRNKSSSSSKTMIENTAKPDTWGDVKGYTSIREACIDVETLLNVIWISGTPSLQIAYLISLAGVLHNILTGIPAPTTSPKGQRALFRVLGKLDHAFASLLQGRDVESGEALPGFDEAGRTGKVVSGTEKVRIRSLVERTRIAVVEAFKASEFEFEDSEEAAGEGRVVDSDMDMEGELVLENGEGNEEEDDEEDDVNVNIARVYDLTMVELGDSMEEPSLGIITERR